MNGTVKYPNTGALFNREKRGENSPDMGGDFNIDGEVVTHIMNCVKAGVEVKLEVSAWAKRDRNNKTFLSLKIKTPWVKDGEQMQPPPVVGYQPQPNNPYAQARGGQQPVFNPPVKNGWET